MSEIFFTSDTHYDHKNICRGTSAWQEIEEGGSHQQTRDFLTLEKMNSTIVDAINREVGANDTLYHLGDWSFNGKDNIKKFRERINCNNIHLIFGNHDQHIEPINSPYRSLFESCDYYKEVHFGKGRASFICLSHYAMRVWNKRHHGSFSLYGHSHGSLPDAGDRSMDVGVDTNFLYEPYSLDYIIDTLGDRKVEHIDHHTNKTN